MRPPTRLATLMRPLLMLLLVTMAHAMWPFSSSKSPKDEERKDRDVMVSPISNREVQVTVTAPSWPSTPHNVLCEAWALVQPHWGFLDALVEIVGSLEDSEAAASSYRQATQLALQAATAAAGTVDTCQPGGDGNGSSVCSSSNPILPTELLKYALMMRAQSPTCELHRGLAEDVLTLQKKSEGSASDAVDAFAIVYPSEQVAWSTEDIAGLVEACVSINNVKFDDILLPNEKPRVSLEASPLLIVMYANLGTPSFVSFYQKLIDLNVPFVVRHRGISDYDTGSTLSSGTILQGYGARLDIRNVEYKVFDDRGEKSDAAAKNKLINATGMETMVNQVFAGVNLTALGVDNTTLQAILWAQHEAQEQHSQLLPPTWQRRQLSLQAAYVVSQSGPDSTDSSGMGDPLVTLEEVSQNLPSVASTLVHVKVPNEFEEVVVQLERPLQQMKRSSGGGLWINGQTVAIQRPSFNVFELIRLLQSEYAELFKLRDLMWPYFLDLDDGGNAALADVQRAWMMGDEFGSRSANGEDDDEDEGESNDDNAIRIDVGRGWRRAIIYLNDIEKDSDYASWPRSVKQMLMSIQYGMPPAVRRNMFTILGVVDPTKLDKPIGLDLASQLVQSQYPARIGLLIVADSDIKICSEWVSSSKSAEGESCPMEEPLFPSKQVTSVDDLKSIILTARVYHRLLTYVADEYKHSKRIVMAYGEYMTSAIYQQVASRGGPIFVFGLLSLHNQLLQGMQVVSRAPPMLETYRALVDMEEKETAGSKKPEFDYGKAVRFAVDKGLSAGMSFLNGRPMPASSDDDVQEKMGQLFMKEQQHIFDLIMKEEITDSEPRSVYAKLLSGGHVFPKVHPLLSSVVGPESFAQLNHRFGTTSLLDAERDGSGDDGVEADAVFVVEAVVDLDTAEGRAFVSKLVGSMDSISATISGTTVAAKYRILPSTKKAANTSICTVLAHAGLLDSDTIKKMLFEESFEADINSALATIQSKSEFDESKCSSLPYLDDSDTPKSNYLIANGRVYYPENPEISRGDIELLMSLVIGQTKAVTKMLRAHINSPLSLFDAVASTCAFLSVSNANPESYRGSPESDIGAIELEVGVVGNNPLRFEWNQNHDDASLKLNVVAMVDPTTETAQRMSPLLRVIRDQLKLPLTLILAPRSLLDGDAKIPITSYYRFVTDPIAYQDDGKPPMARFSYLPTNHILTLRMDVPEPWNIQQTKSIQDTDNLRCDIQSGCSDADYAKDGDDGHPVGADHVTRVDYGLLNLLFFGQCYQARGTPPNGLQLTLNKGANVEEKTSNGNKQVEIGPDGTISSSQDNQVKEIVHFSDTVVMKNVGYWQLQAGPGVWSLSIDKNSRGSEIFDMVDGTITRGGMRIKQSNITFPTKRLVMKDFVSRGELLVVKRRPGYEKASLFYEDNESSTKNVDDTIHVFSLATGHLYERFLKIMMLSVTKRTSSKVKFWLFGNFLSPSFKSSATAMAQKIGCEVEFVTYKWPEWLRGQSEKQRIIWGYKILFLDVLFPLSVKKIIYVDADQVVRGDLKELWDMDLQGAPYGYTPFCTSRETTLGFQFWNTGFWESHLRGKPYHISALYVVDLDRFRKMLVGDQLRTIYHSLSADPNSLANLDQDLPNYAQHQVPIFSLPQEWLWCETWCSDETKPAAKTIDLCNNPLHKEPKVSMAKRIISGDLFPESWIELDAEVEKYEKEYLASIAAS